ncbi:MAG: T9SS type A sorting domain-containing protein [Candidatus Eiseniibacteriota bacterium]
MTKRALDIRRPGWLLAALPVLALVAGPAAAQHTFDGNITIVFQNGGPNFNAGAGLCVAQTTAIRAMPHNDEFLALPAGFWGGVDPRWPNTVWRPSATSVASGDIDDVATIAHVVADTCNACGHNRKFTQTCYRGAIDPNNPGSDWTQTGWLCYGDSTQCLPGVLPPVVIHSGVQGTSTWTAAETHLLRGKVSFPAGTKLTIEPGTIILGEKATGPSFLAIDPGALIDARGTSGSPITMTSDQAVGVPGDWGGFVVSGKAIANCADCLGGSLCANEGDPTIQFCGTDDCDSSGVMTYIRSLFAGFELAPNNELNSFTMNAVGNRTEISYIQAHRGSDDALEWFGGTANCDHLVATGYQDDGLDWQAGFRGTVQFAVVQLAVNQGERGIEADNWEFDHNAPCRSNPLFANVTLIGPHPGSTTAGDGIMLRRGTDAQIFNSIIFDFPSENVQLSDDATCARGVNPNPATFACGVRVSAPVVATGRNADAVSVRAFPNPMVSEAQFSIALVHSGPTHLDVYDVNGRHVANVLDRDMSPGEYAVSWTPGTELAPGAYFYRLQNGGKPVTGKFVVMR